MIARASVGLQLPAAREPVPVYSRLESRAATARTSTASMHCIDVRPSSSESCSLLKAEKDLSVEEHVRPLGECMAPGV